MAQPPASVLLYLWRSLETVRSRISIGITNRIPYSQLVFYTDGSRFALKHRYGAVFSGVLHDKYPVAIKKMFTAFGGQFDDSEIKILLKVHHPKLVMFLGCGTWCSSVPSISRLVFVLECFERECQFSLAHGISLESRSNVHSNIIL